MSSEAIVNRFSHRFVVPDLETTMSGFTATQDIEWHRGEVGYDEARRVWNLAVDQRPSVVVVAESVAVVVRAVRFARSHGIRIAPQGTGHGAVPLEPLEGAMLVKTSRMGRVDIYPATRTARVEAGAEWQDVTVPACEHRLPALAGSSPNTWSDGPHARRRDQLAGTPPRTRLSASYQRLQRIKAAYDPDQTIISAQPVRPAKR